MMCSFFCLFAGALPQSLLVATEQHVESDGDIRLGKPLYKGSSGRI